LFMPAMIIYAKEIDLNLVKSLGIALMIGQPLTIIYQGVISLKLKSLKALSSDIMNDNLELNIGVYNRIVHVGMFGSLIHALVVLSAFTVLSHFSKTETNTLFSIVCMICSMLYINAVFGPNGTLLGLINKSHLDAYCAGFKILLVIFVGFTTNSFLLMIFCAMLAELIGNTLKNMYLLSFLKQSKPFVLIPFSVSSALLAINYYVVF